jgi:hypothetical protein
MNFFHAKTQRRKEGAIPGTKFFLEARGFGVGEVCEVQLRKRVRSQVQLGNEREEPLAKTQRRKGLKAGCFTFLVTFLVPKFYLGTHFPAKLHFASRVKIKPAWDLKSPRFCLLFASLRLCERLFLIPQ